MRLKPRQAVEVLWVDASEHSGWHWEDELHTLSINECRSVGYMMEETTKDFIYLCRDESLEQVGSVMIIPKAWVKKVRKLK